MRYFKTAGFTIFELLLVVFLLVLFYAISINTFDTKQKSPKQSANIKEFLLNYKPSQISSLICFDDCSRCVVVQDGREVYNSPNKFTSQLVEVYNFDDYFTKQEFPKFYYGDKFKNVCLRFDLFANGANSSFVIKDNEKYTFYSSYFNNTKVFDSEDEATQFLAKKREFIPVNMDDFAKESISK